MSHEIHTLEDLLSCPPETSGHTPNPFAPLLGGCAETEASDLASAVGIDKSGPTAALLHSMSYQSYAKTTCDLHHTIDYKVRGIEMCGSLAQLYDTARECLEPDRRFEAPLLTMQLLDLYGPMKARQLTSIIEFLSAGIELRREPLQLEDPFTLDLLAGALLYCLRQGKPDATAHDALLFVKEALIERWPATEPSIRASVERVLRKEQLLRDATA